MKYKLKFYFLFVYYWVWSVTAYTQVNNFETIFGEDYIQSCRFLEKNNWMDVVFAQNHISPIFARSIVFPELLRYNNLMDQLEIQGLFCLYVQYGKDYANFSIGNFQIKPSFAEDIEKDLYRYPDPYSKPMYLDTSQTTQARLARVQRLKDIHWQVRYLVWFIQILDKRFQEKIPLNPEKKLLFYATAYNCGYKHDLEYIQRMQQQKFFHTDLFFSSISYNYASISLSYWIEQAK